MMKALRDCEICRNEEVEILHKQIFGKIKESPIEAEYQIVCCNQCGFVYADTASTQEDYDQYYAYMSKYQNQDSSGSGTSEFDYERINQGVNRITKFLKSKEAKILDMGCANGGVLQELYRRGYSHLLGIDPSIVCVHNTLHKGIEAIRSDIFSYKPIEKFDCIIFSHVLEHIRDLKRAVQDLTEWLKDDGILYIEVPNAGRYAEQYIVPYYYFDCEHINHFDKISLCNLLDEYEGVAIEEKDQHVSAGIEYPILAAVFKKRLSNCGEYVKSHLACDSIKSYLDLSMKDHRLEIISQLYLSKKAIIVWGAGQYTLRLLGTTDLKECNIIAFIDNDENKQGKSLNGIPIFPKGKIEELCQQQKVIIIIASALAASSIKQEIQALEIKQEIIEL